ncbi:MAG: hypothetical protein IPJ14_14875 [Kineosporiaceae bacterium]|nr:hypothetical protein [Kineosporiaceae bacterium]
MRIRTPVDAKARRAGRAALEAAGALSAEQAHPQLAAAVAAVRQPLFRCEVTVSGAHGVVVHQVWGGLDAAAVLAHWRGQTYQLFTVAPDFVAMAHARLVRLGLRPRLAACELIVDDELVIGLLDLDDAVRAAAAGRLADAGAELWGADWARSWTSEPAWRCWSSYAGFPVAAESPADSGADVGSDSGSVSEGGSVGVLERVLWTLDTPQGLLDVRGGDDGVAVLSPTDPTAVWASLTAMVPPVGELVAALAGPLSTV